MICFCRAQTISFDTSKIIEALEKALGNSIAKDRNERIQHLIDAMLSSDFSEVDAYHAMRAETIERHLNQRAHYAYEFSNLQKMIRMEIVQKVRQTANLLRRTSSSERLPQSDTGSIALHASQPVPPTILMKGGYHSVSAKGV